MNNCIILAGGQGKRMKTTKPKVLLEVLGEPMLEWVIKACESAGIENICVVKGYEGEQVEAYLSHRKGSADIKTVLQSERLGTGHAVMMAADYLKERNGGNTLILCGDAPFIDKETIEGSLALHTKEGNAVTVVTSEISQPHGYGRIIRNENGISGIVEEKDCTDEQRKINEINSGCYWFDTASLIDVLSELKPNNAQNEYYLTDCISLLLGKGKRADAYISHNKNVSLGANDRRGLLMLNDIARMNIIDKWLDFGIEFTCLDGVSIGTQVEIGAGTVIESGVRLSGKTKIGEGCHIMTGCMLNNTVVGNNTVLNFVQSNDAVVEDNVKIGPWVQLRPDTVIKSGVKIGDFVEIKNSVIGECTAVAHLTYVGDSDVGANVNFGCGCVTVNFDGEKKFRTTIGDNSFIGCNTNLVAPVKVGRSAYTAAGTTVTKDVPDGALAIDRNKQANIAGYAEKKLKARNEKIAAQKKA